MKTALTWLLACLCSATGRLAMLALTICAPLHLVHAQAGPNAMSLAGGNNQSAQTFYSLPDPLTVSFSGSSYVFLEWQVTSGSATFQESGTTDYVAGNGSLVTSPGSTTSVHLILGGTVGPVTVTATCSGGCTTAPFVLTFNETVTAPPPALEMQVNNGNNQSGAANTTAAQPLEVLLTHAPGFDGPFTFPLQWAIESGAATFTANHGQSISQTVAFAQPPGRSASTAVSQAFNQLTADQSIDFGTTPGPVVVSVYCSACTSGGTRVFRLTVLAPTTGALSKISGDNQTGVVGSSSDLPLVVQLGTPGSTTLTGQPINWSVISGQATLSATSTVTDSNGQSSITFNYGTTAGTVIIEASSTNGKVDFTATSSNATVSVASGNNQTGVVGGALAPFVVQITGPATSAKGLSQVPITWNVTSGGGTLASTSTVTDVNGKSANTLTLGPNTGNNAVTATIPGVGNVTVNFTATALLNAGIASLSGNGQTSVVGSALQPFVVQVVSNGQAVPGINVNWSVTQGGGTLAAANTLTNASGDANNTLTLGTTPGVNLVRATIPGMGSISFSANGTVAVGSNSQFTIVSGNGQALTPGQASQPLVVKLVNAQGQPVNGATVAWSVSGSSGKLGSATSITDTTGQAQNLLTVVLPGSYTVTAQLPGNASVPALTFGFNNGVANLPALSPTQTSVAHAIDKACPALAGMSSSQLTAAQQDLLQRCSEIVVGAGANPQQVPDALTQMLNNKALPQNQLANSVQLSQFGNLNTRLAELRQGAQGFSIHGLTLTEDDQSLPLAMLGDAFRKDPKQADDEIGKDFDRWGFFATGMIERGGYSANGSAPGFDFHNASLTAGVDYRFTDAFVAGGALGYNTNNSTLDQNFGTVDVNSYSLNGYFTWYHNNDFYVEGSVVLDWLNYDLSRNIVYQIASLSGSGQTSVNQTANASPDGHQDAFSLSIGKDFSRGAWTISPYVRGIYTHLSLDGFSETISDPNSPGAGLGTSVDSRSLTSELAVLGGRFSYTTSFDWGVLVPNATLEWNHEFKNDPQSIVTRFLADPTQTPIVVTDTAPDQNYFNVGIGLNAVLPQGRSGFITWEHLVGFAGAHENRFSLGIRVEF
ncbi:MAG: autotransporter domain-containing protein [Rudaea sp.]|nr:autotransporter domain-containing protein [Rudaea sp.]